VQLKAVTRTSPWNAALKDGRVEPRGYTLAFEEVEPVTRAFRLMSRELAYDVTEMAATTYFVAREHGKPFTALPVFLTRGLHHRAVLARAPGDPRELEGERVGVNRGYTVTTGVWARGILATEYGVELDSITWVRSDAEHVAEYEPPANVVDLSPGENLLDGDFRAVVGDVKSPELVPLIEDADAAAERALAERGLWPVNHLVVVKDELLAEHRDLAGALFAAFERAKDLYVASDELTPLHRRVREITGADPLPYGLEPNRAVVEELIDHAVAQKILRRRPAVDELFAAV
jgi:4,5-dihydroxyphthalate decarboxylase